jgi:Esterase PHB depolymerase
MNQFKKIDMIEATRLTREGRLEDVVKLLLGAAASSSEFRARRAQGAGVKHFLDFQNAEIWQRNPPTPDFLLGQMGQLGSLPALRGPTDPLARKQVPIPDGARFEERVYLDSSGSRAYKLYVPSGYIGHAVPLVVMLHGCKQSPDDFALGTRMNNLAEEQCFLVAYPAQSTSANASRCWNWFKATDQQRDQGEPSLIAGITGRGGCRDHGSVLSGPVRGRRRPFRTRLRRCGGYVCGICRDAGRRPQSTKTHSHPYDRIPRR